MFQYTTAIAKLRSMTARKKVVQGGTSAGKTYGIIPILIDQACRQSRLRITVVAESIPAVRDGAVRIFKDVMLDTGRWADDRWNATLLEYLFGNGTVMQFKSFDTVGKAKASGKRDILFLNEANHIPYEIADALMIRSKETWIDYNPDNEFWVHTEVLREPNSEFLLLKYTDNEALPPETFEDLMIKVEKAKTSEYWKNWCRVYIDGEIGKLQGTVFDFRVVASVPLEADLIGYGLDWGFTNDPTALVAVYRCNGELYLEELIYRQRLTNRDIAARMTELGVSRHKPIVADSAEPKSIQDLWDFGWANVQAARKGPDSVRFSIDKLQNFPINITAGSVNVLREFRGYCWETNAAGQSTGRPVEKNDHSINAVQYVGLNLLNENSGIYHIF